MWKILDDQHEELDHVRADEAYKAWVTAHRKHGESLNTWTMNLQKVKLELPEAKYNEMILSRRMYASKLMRGSGLSADKRALVLFNAGGIMVPV